jgi:hypothetical protein
MITTDVRVLVEECQTAKSYFNLSYKVKSFGDNVRRFLSHLNPCNLPEKLRS